LVGSTAQVGKFDQIFDRHHEAVQRYCLRRLPWHEVNDVVADVFLVAWRRIEEAPESRELLWLYGIAKNVIRNAHRSLRRQDSLRRRVSAQERRSEPSAEVHVVRSFEERNVLDALASLRVSDQEILRLKCWEQLGNGEIAALLGISPHAVDMRLSRARRQLERALARADSSHPAQVSRPVTRGGER
jgi:RNA polymerase sigma-70 factor (ECF subfamily)